jgi:uncharacterized membrane protein
MAMSGILVVHVGAGAIAMLAGAAALALRKGSARHRAAGNIFFAAMLAMAGIGGFIALTKPVTASVNGMLAALALYFAATAWATVRRPERRIGWFDYVALAAALAIGGTAITLALNAPIHEPGVPVGIPAVIYYIFAAPALIGAAFDLGVILRGGLSGKSRIGRHVWRMGLALYIAASSFFIGQERVFPQAVREAGVQYLPVLILIVLTIFWAVRVRFTGWVARTQGAGAGGRP